MKSSKVSQDIFVEFCKETYINYLDDFVHFIKEHGTNSHIIRIAKELKSKYGFALCNISKCNKLKRHYRTSATGLYKNKNDQIDNKFTYYCDFFDKVHHNIFHLFDMGLRLDLTETEQVDKSIEGNFVCFDKIFEKRRDLIKSKKNQSRMAFDRFRRENNKYNLSPYQKQNITEYAQNNSLEDGTLLDSIFTIICKNNAQMLSEYMILHEYDSEALQYDLIGFDENMSQSNIYNYMTDKEMINLVTDYIRSVKLSANSFATGFRFYYWDFYKNLDDEVMEELDVMWKYSLNNGHSIKQLFISPYYESLKHEILSSGFVSISNWNEHIFFKAAEHYKSGKVKSIKALFDSNHGIKCNDQICMDHLMCIVLYCDWSDLQNDFSCTFRKKHEFEPVQKVKQRNAKYYYFSKGLIEAVTDFGIDGYGFWKETIYDKPSWVTYSKDAPHRTEPQSPFYCGLSVVLNIPTFAIPFGGPCSTTKNIEIAINFAKRDGMIMQLINDEHANRMQNYFDCSWISNYSEENERLFMFTEERMKIQSILIIESSKNFQDFFHAFYIFDRMISNDENRWAAIKVLRSDNLILNKLINRKLKTLSNMKYEKKLQQDIDQYIIDTFDLFLSKKIEIELSIHHIYENFEKLSGLLFCGDNNSHVLDTRIIPIFSNLKRVVINTAYNNDYEWNAGSNGVVREYMEYPFSLMSFLSSIEKCTSQIEYIIRADKNDLRDETWMCRALDEDFSIDTKFEDKQWDMCFVFVEECVQEERVDLIISKMI